MNPAIILWPDVSTCEYEGVPAVKVTADENCGLDLAALFRSHGLTTKGTYPLYVINSREGDVRCILSNTLLGQYKDVPKLFYYYASADNEPQLELATHGHMLTPETIVDLLKVIGHSVLRPRRRCGQDHRYVQGRAGITHCCGEPAAQLSGCDLF